MTDTDTATIPAASSGDNNEEGQNKKFPLDDIGNAQRLVHYHGDNIRYVHNPSKSWYIWDGTCWRQDDTQKIKQFARESLKYVEKEGHHQNSDATKKLRSIHSIENMIRIAQTMPAVAARCDDFDRDPWLLNCRNCTLDLRDGKIKKLDHDPKHMITQQIDVDYDPEATCPGWLQFLVDIFGDNQKVISYVQRLVGYTLTGDISDEILLFAYGTGKNGKSRFFDALEMLFGEYFYKASKNLLTNTRGGSVPHDTIMLKGKRLVICSELDESDTFSESMVKDMTGGDTINARGLYKDPINFKPNHTLWIYGNHKPTIKGTDHGVWRRVKLIPFNVMISDEQRKPKRYFDDLFRSELSGILNWALAGYADYYTKGLQEPKDITSGIDAYRSEMDEVQSFLDDCCETCAYSGPLGENYITRAKELYDAYKVWSDNDSSMSKQKFNKKLRDKGIPVETNSRYQNSVMALGVRLKS